jgi:hypothetical protein
MKGYVFDPSRLACSTKQQERRGYAVVDPLLRDSLDRGDNVDEGTSETLVEQDGSPALAPVGRSRRTKGTR